LDPDQTKVLLHTAYKNGADKMEAGSFLTNSKLQYLQAWLIRGFTRGTAAANASISKFVEPWAFGTPSFA